MKDELDLLVDEYAASMQWSPETPPLIRELVLSNVRGFAALVRFGLLPDLQDDKVHWQRKAYELDDEVVRWRDRAIRAEDLLELERSGA